MDTDERLKAIQNKLTQAQSRKARAEVEHEQGMERAREAATALKTEFGVTTLAQAAELRDKLAEDLKDELNRAEEALDRADG